MYIWFSYDNVFHRPMNKLQTCLLFIIALPVIVVIGIPLFLLVFGVSFGFISSLISGIREALLPLACIFAAITIIRIVIYIIQSREDRKREMERREEVQRLKDIGLYEGPVGQEYFIRQLFENIADTKKLLIRYKNMIDLP